MSGNNVVTATINNSTTYSLGYDTQNVQWGSVAINQTSIGGSGSSQAFTAKGADGSGTGCAGSVVYTFADQKGNIQDVTFTYNDPYIGSNSASVTAPGGISASASIPSSGDNVAASYSLSGTVTQVYQVSAAVNNMTSYALSYSSSTTSAGIVEVVTNDISANEQQQAFVATPSASGTPGCQGGVTYGFTDQNGDSQTVTFFYNDPQVGDNTFTASGPAGLSITNNGAAIGATVNVVYTISGSVT